MPTNKVYDFTAKLDQYADTLESRLNELFQHVVMLFFQNIVVGGNYSPGTPVDTGFARNSWVVGLNGIGEFSQPPTDPNPPKRGKDDAHGQVYETVSVDRGNVALLDATIDDTVHLTSNCAYMGALENGHSDQAPTGMIALALMGAQQMVAEVAAEMMR